MFVDRRQEIDFLNSLLTRKRPGPAQLALMFGRRRVGKSELLLQWASAKWPALYLLGSGQRDCHPAAYPFIRQTAECSGLLCAGLPLLA